MHRGARLGRGQGSGMIELYTWSTPNGQKVSIMLEEVGLPYRVHPIDIGKGHQFHPDFLAISPNNKIPAIIDTDNGLQLMESGAILLYLAEKTGKLWPQDFPTKWRVVEWLMWQMGGIGPFLGQVHHFVKFNPGKSVYAVDRALCLAESRICRSSQCDALVSRHRRPPSGQARLGRAQGRPRDPNAMIA